MSDFSEMKYAVADLNYILKHVDERDIKLNILIRLDAIKEDIQDILAYLRKIKVQNDTRK